MNESVKNTLQTAIAKILLIMGIAIIGYGAIKFVASDTGRDLIHTGSKSIRDKIHNNFIPSKQNTAPVNTSSAPIFFDPFNNPQQKKQSRTPGYTVVWVKGKSLEECMGKSKELNENVMRCRSGYYEKIPTN